MTRLEKLLARGLYAVPRPWYSAAVALIWRGGETAHAAAVGESARYADADATPAPAQFRQPATASTIFDLASITKLFVATVALTLVEQKTLGLDEAVAQWLPSFGAGDRARVTLRHLLTHTSGLPALLPPWTDRPDRDARAAAVLNAPLVNAPGTVFEYSCVGFLVAGLLAEQVNGESLSSLVRRRVAEPLRLADTGYRPSPDLVPRIAATEYQPRIGRGMVRGSVHDENSWSLGGIAGNAGIFGTAGDVARFGEMLRGYGALDGVRVLREDTVVEMTRNQLPAGIDPGFRHGLGIRVADGDFMGRLADSGGFGHTGFTGTSLVVDRRRALVVVLLTNRVHPSRDWSDIAPLRRRVADFAADSRDAGGRTKGSPIVA